MEKVRAYQKSQREKEERKRLLSEEKSDVERPRVGRAATCSSLATSFISNNDDGVEDPLSKNLESTNAPSKPQMLRAQIKKHQEEVLVLDEEVLISYVAEFGQRVWVYDARYKTINELWATRKKSGKEEKPEKLDDAPICMLYRKGGADNRGDWSTATIKGTQGYDMTYVNSLYAEAAEAAKVEDETQTNTKKTKAVNLEMVLTKDLSRNLDGSRLAFQYLDLSLYRLGLLKDDKDYQPEKQKPRPPLYKQQATSTGVSTFVFTQELVGHNPNPFVKVERNEEASEDGHRRYLYGNVPLLRDPLDAVAPSKNRKEFEEHVLEFAKTNLNIEVKEIMQWRKKVEEKNGDLADGNKDTN